MDRNLNCHLSNFLITLFFTWAFIIKILMGLGGVMLLVDLGYVQMEEEWRYAPQVLANEAASWPFSTAAGEWQLCAVGFMTQSLLTWCFWRSCTRNCTGRRSQALNVSITVCPQLSSKHVACTPLPFFAHLSFSICKMEMITAVVI